MFSFCFHDDFLIRRWVWNAEVLGLLSEAVLLVQTQKALCWGELGVRHWAERRSWWGRVYRAGFSRVQRERSHPVKAWTYQYFILFLCQCSQSTFTKSVDSEDWEMEALRASGRSALGSAVASAEESLEVQPVTWELLFNWLRCCVYASLLSVSLFLHCSLVLFPTASITSAKCTKKRTTWWRLWGVSAFLWLYMLFKVTAWVMWRCCIMWAKDPTAVISRKPDLHG